MEIILGKNSGFCFGVKRAVEGCKEQLASSKKIYCLGELVHNKNVISNLEQKGITFINTLDEVTKNNSKVIIRAHGIPKETYEEAKYKNLEIVDYTCPFVLKIHNIANEYNKNGYYIFITGKKDHPEVIGIKSFCDNYSIIENIDDVENVILNFKNSKINKLLLISQTTFSLQKFNEIRENIKNNLPSNIDFIVKNTICNSTETRQKETEQLSKTVDYMIIIGGKNSSNTRKII